MYLFNRHLLHPHWGSPAVRSHPLGPGCMMRSEGEEGSLPPMEGGTSTSSWDHVPVDVMIMSVLQDESCVCGWYTLTFLLGRKGLFLQLLGDCLQVGSALGHLWGMVSGEESHLARGHAHTMDWMMHVKSCRIHWRLPGRHISPCGESCWHAAPFIDAVLRILPKLTPNVLTPIPVFTSRETQPAIYIQSCKSLLDEYNPATSQGQVVPKGKLSLGNHIYSAPARTCHYAGGVPSPVTTTVIILVLSAPTPISPWTGRHPRFLLLLEMTQGCGFGGLRDSRQLLGQSRVNGPRSGPGKFDCKEFS